VATVKSIVPVAIPIAPAIDAAIAENTAIYTPSYI
jgi:hypothetical protein